MHNEKVGLPRPIHILSEFCEILIENTKTLCVKEKYSIP